MRVVPGDFEEDVQRLLEVFAQLLVACLVVIAQNIFGETLEFPRVVVSRGQTRDQGLSETATAQCRNAGRQDMLRRTTVNSHGLALEAQFASVAGGAGDIEIMLGATGIRVAGEADRQIAGVVRRGFLLWINQKTEACEVFRGRETLLREGQFQRLEPFIAQAFDLCALRREVVGLAFLLAPLLQVMHLLGRDIEGQFRVGDVVQNHCQSQAQQHNDQCQHTV